MYSSVRYRYRYKIVPRYGCGMECVHSEAGHEPGFPISNAQRSACGQVQGVVPSHDGGGTGRVFYTHQPLVFVVYRKLTSTFIRGNVVQDSSLGRTTRTVEIEDERKNNLLSIMVRGLHLTRDWRDRIVFCKCIFALT